jgi:hypothetical protein
VGVDGALVDAGSIWSTKWPIFAHHIYGASMIKRGRKKVFQNPVSKLSPMFMKNEKKLFLFHLKGDNKKVQLKAPKFAKHVITSNHL